jgi:predicted O-linked N-acetylglucosamine transferase (SPINDLY family)
MAGPRATLQGLIRSGIIAGQSGKAAAARALFERAIAIDPKNAVLFNNKGLACQALRQWDAALASFNEALRLDAGFAEAYGNRGNVERELGRSEAALTSYDRALAIRVDFATLYNRGVVLSELHRWQPALESFDRAIALQAGTAAAHYNRGNVLRELARYDAALASYDAAVALDAGFAEAHANRGNVLKELGRLDEALAGYGRAIDLKADFAAAHYNRALLLQERQQWDAALKGYDAAIEIDPGYVEALVNRGNVQRARKLPEAALADYERAIAIRPSYAPAYLNRGHVRRELQEWGAALASYEQALAIEPGCSEAWLNLGHVQRDLQHLDAALANYEKALAIDAGYAQAHYACADIHLVRAQYAAAAARYEAALALDPQLKFLLGLRRHARMRLCDWQEFDTDVARLAAGIARGEALSPPFPILGLSGSAALQRQAAEIWMRELCPPDPALGPIPAREPHERIRIGYFSADFRNHPVALLTAELFETHDRSRFETTAFAFGPGSTDEMRTRLERAFDRFIDVSKHSDRDIARLARTLEVDIAVDLGGFTGDLRSKIFALRAAPLQVGYLGYLGTMGAPYIDYLIADAVIVPGESRQHYAEKILYLPSYQANDSKRRIADKFFTREELGLPASGFIYCCFNASYKITPGTFAGWMRILGQVPGSVLWLLGADPIVVGNLRAEARAHAVAPERLVFGGALPLPEYLARFRTADLFLDTLPYNAGTTASDALWAGLPVLTCAGETFAGRVAASLLTAIRVPELIAATQSHYEALAVELATRPARLAEIRQRVAEHRLTTPLFDTRLFTHHLEAAYTKIYERHRANMPAAHLHVE